MPLSQAIQATNEPHHARVKRHLAQCEEAFPGCWKTAERMRQQRGRALPLWPPHVYLPLAGAASIVTSGHPDPPLALLAGPSIAIVGALSAWRSTQGIYVLDPDLFEALWTTPLTGELPHQLLHHLPEWCCYIACPTLDHSPGQAPQDIPGCGSRAGPGGLYGMHGFYAHLEWDVDTHEEELRLLLDTTTVNGPGLLPLAIHLGEWDLQMACQRSLQVSLANMRRAGDADQAQALTAILPQASTLMRELTQPCLSLVLYLCSVAADIRPHVGARGRHSAGTTALPKRPQEVQTKHGARLFAPAQPTIWEVGYRLGAVLRAARALPADNPALSEGEERLRRRPRAHIRRAHFHLFWTGAGRHEPRVRWLHPALVAAERGALVPTIHPVE